MEPIGTPEHKEYLGNAAKKSEMPIELPGLKYPCNVHSNIHAKKSIHSKILEWTSIVHEYSIDT